jgi:hypothetical protein
MKGILDFVGLWSWGEGGGEGWTKLGGGGGGEQVKRSLKDGFDNYDCREKKDKSLPTASSRVFEYSSSRLVD